MHFDPVTSRVRAKIFNCSKIFERKNCFRIALTPAPGNLGLHFPNQLVIEYRWLVSKNQVRKNLS